MKIFSNKHSFKIFKIILLFFLLILIIACTNKPELILLEFNSTDNEKWEHIINKHPLPDIYQFVQENPENKLLPEIKIFYSTEIKSLYPNNEILLKKSYLVPGTDFWNPLTDISFNDISNYPHLPLEEIELPIKGLSIEGLYPGDTGYPLIEKTLLSLTFPDNYMDKNNSIEELLSWFNNLKLTYDQSVQESQNIIWIAGVGDMMVQRGVEIRLMNHSNGIDYIFGNTLNILQSQDLLLGNLEGSVTYSNTKTPKSYNFKFNPKVLPLLKEAGFDYFSLTNNHIFDYGETGFIDTLKHLREANIPTSGAGLTKTEAVEYIEIIVNNNTIRILSMGAYPRENNGWDGRTMAQISETRPGILFEGNSALQAVKNMASPSSFDILMIHGGVEWTSAPKEIQRNLYRTYLDAGADIILGSHPHVLQGLEEWEGKLIAYSLGNFIFPGMGSMKFAEESMILSMGIYNTKIRYINPIPVNIDNQKISIDNSGIILERFKILSKKLIRSK